MEKIAVIIPTFNEIQNIERIIISIKKFYFRSEIYVIDDTKTNEIGQFLNKKKIKVNYYHRKNMSGRGSAVLFGLKKALKNKHIKIFVEMDADFSHHPRELKNRVNFLKKRKLDLLIASRYLKGSKIYNWSIQRKILSFLSNYLAKKFLKINLTDFTNGYRVYSIKAAKIVVKECGKVSGGFILLSEIILVLNNLSLKLGETKTKFINRSRGKSNVNLRLIIESFIGLIKLSFRKNK